MLTLPWTGAVVSEEDWHWAVGIWEGEGYVGVVKNGAKRQTRFDVVSTDMDMLVACANAFDLGRLHFRGSRIGAHKDAWALTECRRDVLKEWCRMAMPYLRTERRRLQAGMVLDWCCGQRRIRPGRKTSLLYGRDALKKK